MQLNRESNTAKYQITKYTAASVTINTQEYYSSILVTPQHLAAWPVTNIHALQAQDLLDLAALAPTIILLGTGANLVFPDPAITQVLYTYKIGLECMTTPAACRTYTALTAEGRNVLAALIIP